MENEVEVLQADVLCVQHPEDKTFVVMNLKTRETWPITKSGMLALASNLDNWFQQFAREEHPDNSPIESKQ
jgi:hypothetical protein